MQWTKSTILPSGQFCTKKFFIQVFIEQMKRIVMGDKGGWIWMSRKIIEFFFGNFGLSGLWCNEQNQRFFHSILLQMFFLDWVPDGGIRTCSGWGRQGWKWSKIKKSSTSSKFWTVKTLMQGTQIDNSPIKNCFTTKKFSVPTLIQEMKPVVLVKYEFEYREKFKLKWFPWKCRTIRILMRERKTMIVELNTRLQVLCFRWRIWWRKSNWWWLRIKSLNIEGNQNKQHLLDYFDCHESHAWIETKALLIELSSTNGKFSMKILVEGIITVVNENFGLGYPDKSSILNL